MIEKIMICYLCNREIEENELSEDHIFPQLFITRDQPKAKGFDYAGKIYTHKLCNNKFGGESEAMCQKALLLLDTLYKLPTENIGTYSDKPVMLITNESFSGFTEKDFDFFGLNDLTRIDIKELKNPAIFEEMKKVNPFVKPTNIALSVLAKSAAAFLVKRANITPDSKWNILSIFILLNDDKFDLDKLLGETKPLESGIKIYPKMWDNKDWFVAYKVNSILVLFNFSFSDDTRYNKSISELYPDDPKYLYVSDNLMDLIGYKWNENVY